MEEKNLTQCKVCSTLKLRVQDGKYENGKNKRWRDETGHLWMGKTCPDCHRNRMAETQRKKKAINNDENSSI